jgi:hypothetical protein
MQVCAHIAWNMCNILCEDDYDDNDDGNGQINTVCVDRSTAVGKSVPVLIRHHVMKTYGQWRHSSMYY